MDAPVGGTIPPIIPLNHIVCGTCSLCNGPVTVYAGAWAGILPPPRTCAQCGATEMQYGPVIPMVTCEAKAATTLDFSHGAKLADAIATKSVPQYSYPGEIRLNYQL